MRLTSTAHSHQNKDGTTRARTRLQNPQIIINVDIGKFQLRRTDWVCVRWNIKRLTVKRTRLCPKCLQQKIGVSIEPTFSIYIFREVYLKSFPPHCISAAKENCQIDPGIT